MAAASDLPSEPDLITPGQDGHRDSGSAKSGGIFKSIRATYQAMSDWGDEVERTHFNGDFIKAVSSAPRKAVSTVSETIVETGRSIQETGKSIQASLKKEAQGEWRCTWEGGLLIRLEPDLDAASREDGIIGPLETFKVSEELEKEVSGVTITFLKLADGRGWVLDRDLKGVLCELVKAKRADGDLPTQTTSQMPDFVETALATVDQVSVSGLVQGIGSSISAQFNKTSGDSTAAEAPNRIPPCRVFTAAAVADHAAMLQLQLDREGRLHEARHEEIMRLTEEIRTLSRQVEEERELLARAEEERADLDEREDEGARLFDDLQEKHQAALCRKASLETELRQETIAADLAIRAANKARKEGAWAREGPETEALKNAKITLAETLADVDEARLLSRRELATLQKEIDEATAECTRLRRISAEQGARKIPSRRNLFGLMSDLV